MPESHECRVWIDTLIARSDELRRAGILSISIGEASATLAPWIEPAPKGDHTPVIEPEPRDVFSDPASYPTGIVPGFAISPLGEVE